MKTDLFQSCGHCWVFQICWHIVCTTFTASSFRIWNSSTGIPSPPVPLFVVMLPKAHLTSHSRMSGSRWVITPLWLSGLWRSFLYSSVYSCQLFLISSASFRIWNSSRTPSPPLGLFVVMLPKAYLTSHSRMSGSRWVITLSWLSGSWRSFLYSSSVYSCHQYLLLLLGP